MSESDLILRHEDFMLIRDFIVYDCGVKLQNVQLSQVEGKLMAVAMENNCKDFLELYLKAKQKGAKRIVASIIDAMRVDKPEWFQGNTPFNILRNIIIPKYINELRTGRKNFCSIWSADCATGQDPYSIAMIVDESLAHEPKVKREQFHILATDTSPNALFNAYSGRYDNTTVSKGMLEGYQDKYFVEKDGVYEVKKEIKNLISFKEFDLKTNFASLPTFDIIFSRNVIQDFSNDYKINFLKKIHMKLDPVGYLFTDMAEDINKYSNSFDTFRQDDYSFYKPKV